MSGPGTSAFINEFPLPNLLNQSGGIVSGPDGNLWFTENLAHEVGIFSPASGAVAQVPIPGGLQPQQITTGPDGNLWFTAAPNAIGQINPTTHAVSVYSTPYGNTYPSGIVAGPDGNVWFTESRGNAVGVISPTTHVIKELALSSPGSNPQDLIVGPDGNLWFTEQAGRIGKVSLAYHAISEVALPANATPLGIAAGPDGGVWFTSGTALGRVDTMTQALSVVAIGDTPNQLVAAPDGNLWFTDLQGKVGKFNPSTGAEAAFATPTPTTQPGGITVGPDGNVWFTESNVNQLGRVVLANVPGTSSVRLSSSTSVASAGQAVALTAVVTGGGPSAPGGSVTFVVDGQAQAPVLLVPANGQEQATYTASNLGAGTHVIAAVYNGDASHVGAVSNAVTLSVGSAPVTDGPHVLKLLAFKDGNQPVVLLLIFDRPLQRAGVLNPKNYRIVSPNGRSIGVRQVFDHGGAQSVVLQPARRFNVSQSYRLTVRGAGIKDLNGNLLDGAGTGRPGTDYTAVITPNILVSPVSGTDAGLERRRR